MHWVNMVSSWFSFWWTAFGIHEKCSNDLLTIHWLWFGHNGSHAGGNYQWITSYISLCFHTKLSYDFKRHIQNVAHKSWLPAEQRNELEKTSGIPYPNRAAGPPFSSPFRGTESVDEKILTKSDRITLELHASCHSMSILTPLTPF